jgi:hypothetical protein
MSLRKNKKSMRLKKIYNKTKKIRKIRKIRRGGGLFDNQETTPPNGVNRSFHTQIQLNGKDYEVDYVIPYTINIKNPNSKRVPAFSANLNGETMKVSIIINDKYVDYFVKVNGIWYVMMRLGLLTLNSGLLAAYTNVVFYKLNQGILELESETNQLIFKIEEDSYNELPNTSWGIFRDSDTRLIQLNKDQWVPVTGNSEEFSFLQRFRNEQLINFGAKASVQDGLIHAGLDILKNGAN